MMVIVGFLPPDDARLVATVEEIQGELAHEGLVRRWTGAEDGAFLACSFWLADCLARMGRVTEAGEVFEAALACANDVGLMAEEWDAGAARALGNFPQALSHVGLIVAAQSIGDARRAADAPRAVTHTRTSTRKER